ncbi:MAG: hypothetical protein DRM98_00730 [Thermoplasmata archaeon]|nr:MAG: DUF2240 family protein [Thermoplasmata archaeon]RLF34391.1 MAG: hypothetical protein DRM98_00730 [Thermoplasmata archaeon]RLF52035.1 MAG: hypothetical protein DRN24_03925 [Thermoplasmata archaeon]
MISEMQLVIAFVFKRSGKKEMSFSELYLTLSMDLNWFTPGEAQNFIKHAIKNKVLMENKELLKPNFDITAVTTPVGFHPSKKIFEKQTGQKKEEPPGLELKAQDVLEKIVHRISVETQLIEKEIFQKIKNVEKEKNVTPEVAALLIGKKHDLSFEDLLDQIEEELFS